MLSELYIENLAVIEKTSISFEQGMNVITGETGAGKSVMIDAINAVLGQRTSREIVRHGAPRASVLARFVGLPAQVEKKLNDFGYPPENGELFLSREIFADQKSAARINGKPVNLSLLREIGAELINIHGQHDNQILLAPEKHIDILDRYGNFEPLLEEYYSCYKNVVHIKRELKHASMSEQEKARKIDLLTYQVREISEAAIEPGEDEILESRRLEIRNAEKIADGFRAALAALYGNENGEGGATELVQIATRNVDRISDFYEGAGDFYSRLDSVGSELEEIMAALTSAMENLNFNEAALSEVEDRLDEIKNLKRKYGGSIEEINRFGETAAKELAALELSDQRIQELNQEATSEYNRLLHLAERVSSARKTAAERFVSEVTGELSFLDMPSVRLEVKLEQVKPGSKGRDAVEFLISTNVGEPPKPIAKIASGGELSRIMLAIKNTLADKDEIPTLIFDEVDTGISGRAAQKVGMKLKQAARYRQILTVTHLAQIAALSDCHFLIQKENDGKHTFTRVEKLDAQGRIREVARIMGTDRITELTLKNAAEMIEQGKSSPNRLK